MIDIPRHEMTLRDDCHRIAKLGEDLEASACDLQLPFDRLIRIGNAADRDHLRFPSRRAQLFPQQRRRVLLHENARLEVEPRGHAEVFVGGAGEAVDAAVLASAIGIDARFESDVRTVVVRDDRPRGIPKIDGLRSSRIALRFVIDDVFELLEPVLRIPARSSSFDRLGQWDAPICSTAVPVMRPSRSAASASFARSRE